MKAGSPQPGPAAAKTDPGSRDLLHGRAPGQTDRCSEADVKARFERHRHRLLRLAGRRRKSGRVRFPGDAAKSDVTGRRVDGFGVTRRGTVAATIVGRAEMG